MRGGWLAGLALVLALSAAPARALDDEHHSLFDPVPEDELRPLCADNPGFGLPPCIVDAGHVMFEFTAVTATFANIGGVRTQNYAIGDVLLRVGLTETLETFASWTPLNIYTEKSGASPQSDSATGSIGFGFKQSLRNPDGEGLSIAAELAIEIPTNGENIAWTLALPVSQAFGDDWTLGFTPELALLPNTLDGGQHLGGSMAVSLSRAIADFNLGAEIYVAKDDEPTGAIRYATANFSVSWQPPKNENLSFDIGADFGLNAATADVEIYCGLSRRF
ncbi:transporter [Polymorphobacter arshaanensis]|uniref:transporter n=1 Tax=Glacieibacterium arshaanense TaxID=2511025 RepID=UPI001407E3BF|nr:transporter [Polymorphobacter arshaanensis]